MLKRVVLLIWLMCYATLATSYGEAKTTRVPVWVENPATYHTDYVQDGVNTANPVVPLTTEPLLLFSDLVSGPDIGLGDGLGSGVIVTVWGQFLGSSQGTNTIEFCDSANVCREPAHIYYWKNADGVAPSGPANLYESHNIQEIAFSIPDSASGLGSLKVTTDDGESNTLPFIVRSGNIYHVMTTGNNTNSGTFSSPWQTAARVGHVQSGGTTAPAGSTVYFHGVTAGGISTTTSNRGIYINNSAATAPDSTTNFFYIAYPGAHSTASGQEGFTNYQISGTAISKFRIEASNYPELQNGQLGVRGNSDGTWGVRTDKWGRIIANYITDQPGRCASRYQGAIVGDASSEDNVSNVKIFGNEIEEYGCFGSNSLHHTTYMTIRSAPDDLLVEPWEFGWNYLHNNHAKSGIHQFDQDDLCGDVSGPIYIRNNVVVEQSGPGIYFGGQCGWTVDAYIESNIIINAGKPVEWNGVDRNTSSQNEPGGVVIRDSGTPPLGGLLGTMYVRNNYIRGIGWDGMAWQGEGCLALTGSGDSVSIVFTDNICNNSRDYAFLGATNAAANLLNNVTGNGNVFYYSGLTSPIRAITPTFDLTSIISNPFISESLPKITVLDSSPIVDKSNTNLTHDLYGVPRIAPSELGPVQYNQ